MESDPVDINVGFDNDGTVATIKGARDIWA
jgi:hypothetical protein